MEENPKALYTYIGMMPELGAISNKVIGQEGLFFQEHQRLSGDQININL